MNKHTAEQLEVVVEMLDARATKAEKLNAEMLESLKAALEMIEGTRDIATSNIIFAISKAEGRS